LKQTSLFLLGCKRGETPGEKLRNKIRQHIEHHAEKGMSLQQRREKRAQSAAENNPAEAISALDKFGQFVAVKLGENIGVQFADTPPGEMIKLSRGSAYGEDNQQVKAVHKPGNMGYIEILNKSSEFFCVKVLRKGGDQKFEVPRPSYIAGYIYMDKCIHFLHYVYHLFIIFFTIKTYYFIMYMFTNIYYF
jgi:hypothetical protein